MPNWDEEFDWSEYLDEWLARIQATPVSAEKRARYSEYAKSLYEQRIPILFGPVNVAEAVGLSYATLLAMVFETRKFYREFTIPKRRGGSRTINAPYPSLLHVQRWIDGQILAKAPLNKSATGFRKGIDLLGNVKPHLGAYSLLKVDIKDFFPSIQLKRVYGIFRRFGYAHLISMSLARLCCLDGCLPQGAVTSPSVSNIVAKRLDARFEALSRGMGLRYTRYADDMTFSGLAINPSLISTVTSIVANEGFRVNEKKTRLVTGQKKKIVTGISVAEEEPHLPKATKRQLRAELHSLKTKGYVQHTTQMEIHDPLYLDRLRGKFSFWKFVEKDNTYVHEALAYLYDEEQVFSDVG